MTKPQQAAADRLAKAIAERDALAHRLDTFNYKGNIRYENMQKCGLALLNSAVKRAQASFDAHLAPKAKVDVVAEMEAFLSNPKHVKFDVGFVNHGRTGPDPTVQRKNVDAESAKAYIRANSRGGYGTHFIVAKDADGRFVGRIGFRSASTRLSRGI